MLDNVCVQTWGGRMSTVVLAFLVLTCAFPCVSGAAESTLTPQVCTETARLPEQLTPGGYSHMQPGGKTGEAALRQSAEPGTIRIAIGKETMTAVFEKNPSAEAFLELLKEDPVIVSMHDFGGFEKSGELETKLVRSDTRITAEPGDVTLYLGRTIAIFYDSNTWNLTRLARIKDKTQTELKKLLKAGGEDVTATFFIE